MAAAIAICIVAFIWIYVRVGPVFSDFIPEGSNATTPVSGIGLATPEGLGTPPALAGINASPTAALAPVASPTPVWEATHQIISGETVNFRGGPSTTDDVVDVLPPGTKLKFVGEQESNGGVTWMHFEAEDGTEGWVRSVDVTPLVP